MLQPSAGGAGAERQHCYLCVMFWIYNTESMQFVCSNQSLIMIIVTRDKHDHYKHFPLYILNISYIYGTYIYVYVLVKKITD